MRAASVASIDAVDADVDDGGAGRMIIGGEHGGAADRRHQDVGLAADSRQVWRFRMADGDGGVFVQQQQRHGLADDIAAADHHGASRRAIGIL